MRCLKCNSDSFELLTGNALKCKKCGNLNKVSDSVYRQYTRPDKVGKNGERMVYQQNGVDIYYYNYKEPFIPFQDGFGFLGALGYSADKEKVQCHFCGNFFKAIRYSHIEKCEGVRLYEKAHNVFIENVNDYKQVVGLNLSSALCGESTRNKLINNTTNEKFRKKVESWNTEEKREERREKLIASNKSRKGSKVLMENKNKLGTCPEQLLARILEVKESIGHVPSKRDFYDFFKGKYLGAIYQTYGSYPEAVKRAGLTPKSLDPDGRLKYSDEELLKYLVDFAEMNKRLSTYSDHERGLLPSYEAYTRHFGNINEARKLAGLPTIERIKGFRFSYNYEKSDPKYKLLFETKNG